MDEEHKETRDGAGEFTPHQIERLQYIIDTGVPNSEELAVAWGISVYAVRKEIARMRAKLGARTVAGMVVEGMLAGIVTMCYDTGRGHAPLKVVRLDEIEYRSKP